MLKSNLTRLKLDRLLADIEARAAGKSARIFVIDKRLSVAAKRRILETAKETGGTIDDPTAAMDLIDQITPAAAEFVAAVDEAHWTQANFEAFLRTKFDDKTAKKNG